MNKKTSGKKPIVESGIESEILKHLASGIFLSKVSDNTIVYTNPRCEKMFGYSAGEMIGKNSMMLYAPARNNTGPSRDDLMNFIKKDGEWHGEVYRLKKDGSVFWSYSNVTTIDHTKYGQVYVVVHNDITGLRVGPESKKNSEMEYLNLFMASRDAIMTLEPPSWKFTSVNPATIKMFKAKNEAELLSYEPWKLSPKTQPDGRLSAEKAKAMIEKAMKEGVNLFEWVQKRINGEEFYVEVLLSRVQRGNRAFLYATARDITERKKAQEAMEKLNQIMIGRELKMAELKKKILELEKIIQKANK